MPFKHTNKVLQGSADLLTTVQTAITAGCFWLCYPVCFGPTLLLRETDRTLSLAVTGTIVPRSEPQENTKIKIKTHFKATAGHQ